MRATKRARARCRAGTRRQTWRAAPPHRQRRPPTAWRPRHPQGSSPRIPSRCQPPPSIPPRGSWQYPRQCCSAAKLRWQVRRAQKCGSAGAAARLPEYERNRPVIIRIYVVPRSAAGPACARGCGRLLGQRAAELAPPGGDLLGASALHRLLQPDANCCNTHTHNALIYIIVSLAAAMASLQVPLPAACRRASRMPAPYLAAPAAAGPCTRGIHLRRPPPT